MTTQGLEELGEQELPENLLAEIRGILCDLLDAHVWLYHKTESDIERINRELDEGEDFYDGKGTQATEG